MLRGEGQTQTKHTDIHTDRHTHRQTHSSSSSGSGSWQKPIINHRMVAAGEEGMKGRQETHKNKQTNLDKDSRIECVRVCVET